MISKTLKRYVWLLNILLKHGELTYDEIKLHWSDSSLYDGKELALRTFHEHRKGVKELFGVEIKCKTCNEKYKYYVPESNLLNKDKLVKWLYNSFALSPEIQISRNVMQRILFDEISMGFNFLQTVINAMDEGKVLEIDYQAFGEGNTSFHYCPYALRAYHQRWYMVGFLRERNAVRHLALDRVLNMETTTETFSIPDDFDAMKFYRNFIGIYVNDTLDPKQVIIRAFGKQVEYLRSLPLHKSQTEVYCKNGEYSDFKYKLCLTPDLISQILAMGDKVEVIEPAELRGEVKNSLLESLKMYQ